MNAAQIERARAVAEESEDGQLIRDLCDALDGSNARAWDEGAKFAWKSSGEGWNGEYPGHEFDQHADNPYLKDCE